MSGERGGRAEDGEGGRDEEDVKGGLSALGGVRGRSPGREWVQSGSPSGWIWVVECDGLNGLWGIPGRALSDGDVGN